jgi:hypothetical protein
MLADEHQVSERPRRGRELLPRFEENGRYLITAYRKLTEAVFEGQGVSPAALTTEVMISELPELSKAQALPGGAMGF